MILFSRTNLHSDLPLASPSYRARGYEKLLCLFPFNRFAATVTYEGINYSSSFIGGSLYFNLIIFSLVEIPANFCSLWVQGRYSFLYIYKTYLNPFGSFIFYLTYKNYFILLLKFSRNTHLKIII